MHFWHSAPFLRILFPCLAAIFCGTSSPLTAKICLWLCIASCLSWFFLSIYQKKRKFSKRWINGIPLQILIFSAFTWYTVFFNETGRPDHFMHLGKADALLIRINTEPEEKANSFKCVPQVLSIRKDDSSFSCSGSVLLYLNKSAGKPRNGDILTVLSRPEPIPPPLNEGEFDYRQYLAYQNIHFRINASPGNSAVVNYDAPVFYIRYSEEIRNYFLSVFRKYIPGDAELGVAEALIFGYKGDLDPATVQAYSNTGTLHVLAVSGLHVAIVFLVLAKLLGFMKYGKQMRILQSLIIICLLWLYALVTGFSASVVRAALMFTIIIIGQTIHRRPNIYNSIAASAFILLACNPYYLFDAGFQLSYMAVLGIVYLQPLLLPLWQPSNPFLFSVWSLTAVSLAAQIGTLPLSLYYFHQFPVYFLLSNLLIIPVSNVVVYTGLLMLALSFNPLISGFLGKLMGLLIWITNETVLFIEKMPGAIISGIYCNLEQMILLFLITSSILAFIRYRRISLLYLSLCCYLFISAIDLNHKIRSSSSSVLIIHHIPKETVIEMQNGEESRIYSSEDFQKNAGKQQYHLQNGWLLRGVKKRAWSNLKVMDPQIAGLSYLPFKNSILAIVDSNFKKPYAVPSIKTKYVLLQGRVRIKLNEVMDVLKPDLIMADGTVGSRQCKKWKSEAALAGIAFHSTAMAGALSLEP